MSDASDITFAKASATTGSNNTAISIHDLGAVRRATSFKIKAKSSVHLSIASSKYYTYSADGVVYIPKVSSDNYFESGTIETYTKTFPQAIELRYLGLEWYFVGGGSSETPYGIDAHDVSVQAESYSQGNVVSTTKVLANSINTAKLFLTAKIPSGTNIVLKTSANDGVTLGDHVLVGSRPDPLAEGFTEFEYDVNFATGGTD